MMSVGVSHMMMLLRIVERDLLAYRDNDNPTSPRTKGIFVPHLGVVRNRQPKA